jgi:hypothetical protein
MPESALLKQILSDYCASNEEYRFQEAMLADFCKYAAQWFIDNSCVGVGHGATGMTLRFADGRELSLFAAPDLAPAQQQAISISTSKDKLVTKTMADSSQSFGITGRLS